MSETQCQIVNYRRLMNKKKNDKQSNFRTNKNQSKFLIFVKQDQHNHYEWLNNYIMAMTFSQKQFDYINKFVSLIL